MSKLKKDTVVLEIITMFLLQAGIALAQPLDVEGHWAQYQILEWLDKGWAECDQDGMFRPNAKITRGEFMAFANEAFGFKDTVPINFSDVVPDDRYEKDVARAVAAGYISGFDDGTVRPDKHISRLEVAVILARIAKLPQSEASEKLDGFTDRADIPAWSKGFAGAVVDKWLMDGYPDGSFKPQEDMTRAEAVFALHNTKAVLKAITENITDPGFLDIQPYIVDSGKLQRITLLYKLGEDFAQGSVVFHLPPGITATAYQDSVMITGSTGETETFKLKPLYIENDGKDVHVTDITTAENGLVILVLEGKKISEPGFHTFSVTADADGAEGSKSATEEEISATVDIFSRILPEGAGILEVSPESAEVGSKQTLTLTYTFGTDFNKGWVEFALPEEITAIAGQDKIIVNGVEKLLTEDDISDDGRKVYVTGITVQKGAMMTLIIYDRTIPEPGPYIFRARSDVDGEVATLPATLGTGSEFMAFLAYSEANKGNDLVKSFVKAINERDGEAALELLADNVTYVSNYMDGYLDVYDSKEDITGNIEYMIDNDCYLVNEENTMRKRAENVWEVAGKSIDNFTELLAQFYPEDGFTGMGYTSKYFVTDNKISYIEFLWNREDEILFDKLQVGSIGVYLDSEGVIKACMPGLPAAKAGLKPGDIIVAVNGINVKDMDYGLEEALYRIKGKAGTTVKLTINRNGKVFDVQMERTADY
jgi:hypothetical protein